jgi:hypothetical protein
MQQSLRFLSKAQIRRRGTAARAFGPMTIGAAVAQSSPQVVLPQPEPLFRGKLGHTLKESTPEFPKEVQAPAGAANVQLILTDVWLDDRTSWAHLGFKRI